MISSRGSVASHLASTTFCWLPPESVETAYSCEPVLTWSRLRPLLGGAPLARPVDEAAVVSLLRSVSVDVPGDGQVHHEALLAAVLRHEADAGGDGDLGIPRA